MFLMKGYAASLMYEKPNRRSAGDIDFYLLGEGEKGDDVLVSKGIKVKQNFSCSVPDKMMAKSPSYYLT